MPPARASTSASRSRRHCSTANNAPSSRPETLLRRASFGQVSLGNNTRQEDWISGTTFASSTKTYNAYGLVATSTDRRGYATGYKYDAFNLYVATATNPLNQQTQYLYNYSNGKPKQTTDPNNRLIKNLYDGVGRLVEVDQSDISNTVRSSPRRPPTNTPTTPPRPRSSIAPTISRRRTPSTPTPTTTASIASCRSAKPRKPPAPMSPVDRLYNSAGLLGSTERALFLLRLGLYHADQHQRALHHVHLRRTQARAHHKQRRRHHHKCLRQVDDHHDRPERQHQRLCSRRLRQSRHKSSSTSARSLTTTLHLRRGQQSRHDDRQPGQRPRLHLRRPRPPPHRARLARRPATRPSASGHTPTTMPAM